MKLLDFRLERLVSLFQFLDLGLIRRARLELDAYTLDLRLQRLVGRFQIGDFLLVGASEQQQERDADRGNQDAVLHDNCLSKFVFAVG